MRLYNRENPVVELQGCHDLLTADGENRAQKTSDSLKCLFRLEAPTSKRLRHYFIKIITQRVRCECSD